MELELKPCPFCGGKAEFKTILTGCVNNAREFGFKIRCVNCGTTIPKTYQLIINLDSKGLMEVLTDERQAAVDDWNRRF